MDSTVQCPECQAKLRVPTDRPIAEYTCPRCQGMVQITGPDSEFAPLAPEPAASDIVAGPPPRPDPPRRDHALGEKGQDSPDIRHPNIQMSCLVSVMTLIGFVGVVLTCLYGLAVPESRAILIAAFLVVLLSAILSTTIVYGPTPFKDKQPSIARVVLTTFSIVGTILVSGCLMTVASAILLFVTYLVTSIRRF